MEEKRERWKGSEGGKATEKGEGEREGEEREQEDESRQEWKGCWRRGEERVKRGQLGEGRDRREKIEERREEEREEWLGRRGQVWCAGEGRKHPGWGSPEQQLEGSLCRTGRGCGCLRREGGKN